MHEPFCAVIGAGIAGASTALHLARRGAKVLLFDQYAFGHDRGSSHGPTRLLRLAYFEHPDYVPLMRRSLSLWRSLEKEVGSKLFSQTGVVEIGPPDGFLLAGVRKAAEVYDLPVDNLSREAFAEKCPWFQLARRDEALFEAEAGYLLADRAFTAQISLAHKYGAALHPGEIVRSWYGTSKGVTLVTNASTYRVDRLIVTAGVWARDFLGCDIAPIASMEKTLFWIGENDPRFTEEHGFLPFAIETHDARMFYGFPAIDHAGVKLGEHTGGQVIQSPDDKSSTANPSEYEKLDEFLRSYAPGLPRSITQVQKCLYEMSPDTNFLIGRHPQEARICFAAGLSGHGFKFAPLIGEALAMLALDMDLPKEFDFLSPARFWRN